MLECSKSNHATTAKIVTFVHKSMILVKRGTRDTQLQRRQQKERALSTCVACRCCAREWRFWPVACPRMVQRVPFLACGTGRGVTTHPQIFSHCYQGKATENGGVKQCISAWSPLGGCCTLCTLAWKWAVTKSLKVLQFAKHRLAELFHVKIPPQKLSVQCGEPI